MAEKPNTKEVWIDGPRGEKIMIVNSKGEFVTPYRMGGESKKAWNKRVSEAQIKSGLFPRLAYAAGYKDRFAKSQYLRLDKELQKLNADLESIEASKGTQNEYQAFKYRPQVLKRINEIEAKLNKNSYFKQNKLTIQNDGTQSTSLEKQLTKFNEKKLNNDVTEDDVTAVVDSLQSESPEDKGGIPIDTINKYSRAATDGKYDYQDIEALNLSNREKPPKSELTIKKEKPPKLKSDVFTLDAEGNRLGVMTNRQRLKWESLEENQALMRSRREGTDPTTGKSKLKIADRTYSSGLVGAG